MHFSRSKVAIHAKDWDVISREPTIETDVYCFKCSYNLRGLTVVHRCPECEFPALRSVILTKVGRRRDPANPTSRLVWGGRAEAYAADILAPLLSCDRNAILFILVAARVERLDQSGEKLCQRILEGSVKYFKGADAARAGLRGWGITKSDDIGRIVAGLVEAGLVLASENDSPCDFAGIAFFNKWI